MKHQREQIFVSTGSYGRISVAEILELSSEDGVRGIELSSGTIYQDEMYDLLKEATDSAKNSFLVHNYFPPPREPFVLNLASENDKILQLSRHLCLKAIDLAADLKSPFYSVHSGFCVNAEPADLGGDLRELERFPKEYANHIFVDSLKLLADYAGVKKLDLLIENNVVAPFNLINGRNELLLGATSDDLLDALESVGRSNVGLLLDVGHLKVSANTLNFNPTNCIRDLAHRIKAVHLSDNDGSKDTNDRITEYSWFWGPLLKNVSEDVVWILEVYNLSSEMIIEQVSLISSMPVRDFHIK